MAEHDSHTLQAQDVDGAYMFQVINAHKKTQPALDPQMHPAKKRNAERPQKK
ncbi:hypothetical protein DSUL_20218 [Desulfovibrionales bacterium]